MLDLALPNPGLHRPPDIFDGHVRVDAMWVDQIAALRPKSLQRRVGDGGNLGRRAVETRHFAVLDVEAELGGDRYLIADGLECLTDYVLIGIWAVHFGRIEESHTCVDRCADDRDPVRSAQRLSVALADSHTTKTERRHLQALRPQNAFLHCCISPL